MSVSKEELKKAQDYYDEFVGPNAKYKLPQFSPSVESWVSKAKSRLTVFDIETADLQSNAKAPIYEMGFMHVRGPDKADFVHQFVSPTNIEGNAPGEWSEWSAKARDARDSASGGTFTKALSAEGIPQKDAPNFAFKEMWGRDVLIQNTPHERAFIKERMAPGEFEQIAKDISLESRSSGGLYPTDIGIKKRAIEATRIGRVGSKDQFLSAWEKVFTEGFLPAFENLPNELTRSFENMDLTKSVFAMAQRRGLMDNAGELFTGTSVSTFANAMWGIEELHAANPDNVLQERMFHAFMASGKTMHEGKDLPPEMIDFFRRVGESVPQQKQQNAVKNIINTYRDQQEFLASQAEGNPRWSLLEGSRTSMDRELTSISMDVLNEQTGASTRVKIDTSKRAALHPETNPEAFTTDIGKLVEFWKERDSRGHGVVPDYDRALREAQAQYIDEYEAAREALEAKGSPKAKAIRSALAGTSDIAEAAIKQAASDASSGPQMGRMKTFIRNNWKIGLMGAGVLMAANLISGDDDSYNYIEGMRHGGIAGWGRKSNTDFGSGWQGLKDLANSVGRWGKLNLPGFFKGGPEISVKFSPRETTWISSLLSTVLGGAAGGLADVGHLGLLGPGMAGGAAVGLATLTGARFLSQSGKKYRSLANIYKKNPAEIDAADSILSKIKDLATPKLEGFTHATTNSAITKIADSRVLLSGRGASGSGTYFSRYTGEDPLEVAKQAAAAGVEDWIFLPKNTEGLSLEPVTKGYLARGHSIGFRALEPQTAHVKVGAPVPSAGFSPTTLMSEILEGGSVSWEKIEQSARLYAAGRPITDIRQHYRLKSNRIVDSSASIKTMVDAFPIKTPEKLTTNQKLELAKKLVTERFGVEISSRDDAYNIIEGLGHTEGVSTTAIRRKQNTDFGSGWNALRGLVRAGETFADMLSSSEFQKALENSMSRGPKGVLGHGVDATAEMRLAMFRGKPFPFVRKTGKVSSAEASMMDRFSESVAPNLYGQGEGHIDMEYFGGQTLAAFVKKSPEKVDFDKIREAVGNIHREGVYHNDLHMNNIMVMDDGNIGIIDYGRAVDTRRSVASEFTYLKPEGDELVGSRGSSDEAMKADIDRIGQALSSSGIKTPSNAKNTDTDAFARTLDSLEYGRTYDSSEVGRTLDASVYGTTLPAGRGVVIPGRPKSNTQGNIISGLPEQGMAKANRGPNTDGNFGSPWQGLRVFASDLATELSEQYAMLSVREKRQEERKKKRQESYLGPQALNPRFEGDLSEISISNFTVEDADTIKFRTWTGEEQTLRLAGIDAPEVSHGDDTGKVFPDQPYGEEAKARLEQILGQQQNLRAIIDSSGGKTHGRSVAMLIGDGNRNINLQLVQEGMAASLPFGKRSTQITDATEFNRAEEDAAAAREGMWSTEAWQLARQAQLNNHRKITNVSYTDLGRLFSNFKTSSILLRMQNPDADFSEMTAAGDRSDHNLIEGMRHGWIGANRAANLGDFSSPYQIDKAIPKSTVSYASKKRVIEGQYAANTQLRLSMKRENRIQHNRG
jgi:endonuclease YncB( thermonuclease family)